MSLRGPWKPYRHKGLSQDENLALYRGNELDAMPELFAKASSSRKGAASRLRDDDAWVSAAWNYDLLTRTQLRNTLVRIRKDFFCR